MLRSGRRQKSSGERPAKKGHDLSVIKEGDQSLGDQSITNDYLKGFGQETDSPYTKRMRQH